MPLCETPSNAWDHIQGFLFPMLREEVGPLTAQHERLVVVLDVARVEAFIQMWSGLPGAAAGRSPCAARALVAKAVLEHAPLAPSRRQAGSLRRCPVDEAMGSRLAPWALPGGAFRGRFGSLCRLTQTGDTEAASRI